VGGEKQTQNGVANGGPGLLNGPPSEPKFLITYWIEPPPPPPFEWGLERGGPNFFKIKKKYLKY